MSIFCSFCFLCSLCMLFPVHALIKTIDWRKADLHDSLLVLIRFIREPVVQSSRADKCGRQTSRVSLKLCKMPLSVCTHSYLVSAERHFAKSINASLYSQNSCGYGERGNMQNPSLYSQNSSQVALTAFGC